MVFNEVKGLNKAGLIGKVLVLRVPRNPPLRGHPTYRKERDFKYLVVFQRLPREHESNACDCLLYRDREGERDRPRLYRTLFTVSKDMECWGVRNYMVLDYSDDQPAAPLLDEVKKDLKRMRVKISEAALLEIQRALNIPM